MIRINKKVEYALMALKHLAECSRDQLCTAKEVSEQFKIPFDTLSKVMQSLNSEQIVGSIQGVKGGYFLTRDLASISYRELEEMIEGKTSSLACLDESRNCNLANVCNIISPIQKLEQKLNQFLSQLNLSELLIEESILTDHLLKQVK